MTIIAFIGLGNMGGPMARNLVSNGYSVCGYDLLADAVKKHLDAGGIYADSSLQAVDGADVVISMLPAGVHVESLYMSSEGLLSILPEGTLVIESSTIEADIARKVANRAAEKGIDFIDAPVSGGTAGAVAGALTFMVGGEDSALAKARPYLDIMGKAVFHAGGAGSGQMAKICNNMLLAVLMTATSEALKLGVDNGLDPVILSKIMQKSSGGNWVLDNYNPIPDVMDKVPASNNYQGGFMISLMAKDLGLALSAGVSSKTPVPMASLASSLYRFHENRSGAELDFSSIYTFYE